MLGALVLRFSPALRTALNHSRQHASWEALCEFPVVPGETVRIQSVREHMDEKLAQR